MEAIGAKSIDLEWVQVHPTGLVKPDDADAKIKFLAAEVHGSLFSSFLDGCQSQKMGLFSFNPSLRR